MQTLSVTVYSDYVCPWCYMAHTSLQQVKAELPLAIDWRAFELQPAESPAARDELYLAEKAKQIEAVWPQVARTAREIYGLELQPTPLGIDTRKAHIGAKIAREHGVDEAYHRRVFAAHWQEGRDISSTEVLVEIAADLGLDAGAFAAQLDDATLKEAVLREERTAHELGIRGVPALILENRYLISGAQPKERLLKAFRQFLDQKV